LKALVFEAPNQAVVADLERPEIGPDEVLVRSHAVGICHSDFELYEGRYIIPVGYPIIPGHEWAGTVEAVGPGVENVDVGAPVVAEGFRACGDCARCREGRTNLCAGEYAETGFTHAGAFAEFLCIPADLVHRLRPGSDLAAAAVLEPAACVACGLLEAELRPGLSVAVVGAGTLGLLAVALLRLTSPARLALVGTRPDRLSLGRELGAGETCDLRVEDAVESLGGDFDLVFEAASRPEGAATAAALARRGGAVVLEGISGAGRPTIDPDLVVLGHLRVQGIFGASRAAWGWVVELFSNGQLDPTPLITHRFPLEDFEAAFSLLRDRDGGALKVELLPGGGV
jgi:threonine dehydrogenase-like Zn-dependent dehydrogenase